MKRDRSIGWLLALSVLCAGCAQPSPQRPSQRMNGTAQTGAPAADSATLALLELNRQLASSADRQLAQWVNTQDLPYALYEAGTWMAVTDKGDEASATPAHGQECTVHMRVSDLDGHLLWDSETTSRIGMNELPPAVDANIGSLHRGAKARLIAPWYSAFGLKGNGVVPPYENVIIDIELK